jgi:ABC-type glycerol-3-phosphate transport system substrate-binding protein
MKKKIRSLISSMLGLLLLASCSFGSSDTQAAVAAQATPALPAVVTLELTVQADTSVTYNTVWTGHQINAKCQKQRFGFCTRSDDRHRRHLP